MNNNIFKALSPNSTSSYVDSLINKVNLDLATNKVVKVTPFSNTGLIDESPENKGFAVRGIGKFNPVVAALIAQSGLEEARQRQIQKLEEIQSQGYLAKTLSCMDWNQFKISMGRYLIELPDGQLVFDLEGMRQEINYWLEMMGDEVVDERSGKFLLGTDYYYHRLTTAFGTWIEYKTPLDAVGELEGEEIKPEVWIRFSGQSLRTIGHKKNVAMLVYFNRYYDVNQGRLDLAVDEYLPENLTFENILDAVTKGQVYGFRNAPRIFINPKQVDFETVELVEKVTGINVENDLHIDGFSFTWGLNAKGKCTSDKILRIYYSPERLSTRAEVQLKSKKAKAYMNELRKLLGNVDPFRMLVEEDYCEDVLEFVSQFYMCLVNSSIDFRYAENRRKGENERLPWWQNFIDMTASPYAPSIPKENVELLRSTKSLIKQYGWTILKLMQTFGAEVSQWLFREISNQYQNRYDNQLNTRKHDYEVRCARSSYRITKKNCEGKELPDVDAMINMLRRQVFSYG